MDIIISHWPFMAFALIVAVTVQVLKATVWTMRRAEKGKARGFFWWGRKTLPLHPVAVGCLVALIPGIPASEGVATLAAKMLYYAASGLTATWIFAVIKSLAKRRGINIIPLAVEETTPVVCVSDPYGDTPGDPYSEPPSGDLA